jgi:hypothetical protein
MYSYHHGRHRRSVEFRFQVLLDLTVLGTKTILGDRDRIRHRLLSDDVRESIVLRSVHLSLNQLKDTLLDIRHHLRFHCRPLLDPVHMHRHDLCHRLRLDMRHLVRDRSHPTILSDAIRSTEHGTLVARVDLGVLPTWNEIFTTQLECTERATSIETHTRTVCRRDSTRADAISLLFDIISHSTGRAGSSRQRGDSFLLRFDIDSFSF